MIYILLILLWYPVNFSVRSYLKQNLREEGRKIKEQLVLKTKSLRNFSTLNIFDNANNKELGSQLHPFGVKSHINCVKKIAFECSIVLFLVAHSLS